MKTRPHIFTRGTAKEIADHADGYVASGEGEYSRRSAATPDVNMRGHVSRQRGKDKSIAEQIEYQTRELARIRGNISLATNPAKIAALRQLQQNKQRLLTQLENSR